MLTESRLRREYAHYRDKAVAEYKLGRTGDSLDAMRLASVICRQYFLQWTEPAFESILQDLSDGLRGEPVTARGDRVVFYDVHATDSYVLTQQYLTAFLSWDIDLLFLTTKDLSEPNRQAIREQLESSPRATVCKVPKLRSTLDTARFIANTIRTFAPSKAFAQIDSYDIPGIIAFGSLEGVERYYIETSDHIFWLGTREFDHYIVFRSLGFNVCVQQRGIPSEKVLMQPYYPVDACKPYRGIPQVCPGDVKVLSGARLEKLYGMGDKYFDLVEGVIKQNPEVQFFFIGAGVYGKAAQTSYLEKQVRKRGIEDRFHLLGYRDDITILMRHMDIYMGTYPIGGGLMTQLAASAGLPIVQYVSPGLSDSVGEFIDCTDRDQPFVFASDEDGFYKEMSQLVRSPERRLARAAENSRKLLSEQRFVEQFTRLVETNTSSYAPSDYPTDCTANRNNQIEVENYCTHDYPRILVKSSYVRRHEPLKYLANTLMFVLHSDNSWLKEKVLEILANR